MFDLDERSTRAIANPVAGPPEMEHIQQRARTLCRRRGAGRAVASATVVVALAISGFVAVNSKHDAKHIRITSRPEPRRPGLGAITRPVLANCKAILASQGVMTGSGHTDPEMPGEVFVVPATAPSGPLAVLLRFPSVNSSFTTANTTVAGQPARVDLGEGGQGGINWRFARGGTANLYAHGLTATELTALAEAITAHSIPLPAGLESLGMTSSATWAYSTCAATSVEVIRGTRASRYARVDADAPGLSWDVGNVTFVVTTFPKVPKTRPAIRQATQAEWDALRAKSRET